MSEDQAVFREAGIKAHELRVSGARIKLYSERGQDKSTELELVSEDQL